MVKLLIVNKERKLAVRNIVICLALLLCACGDEFEECNTEIDCREDKESLCEPPMMREAAGGEFIEVRSCTYITYEHCFEKTVCKERR